MSEHQITDPSAIAFGMAKSASLVRARMTLETLFYHLHKARQNWSYVSETPVGTAYKGTLLWAIAQSLPQKYELEIKRRSDDAFYQAMQDTFKKSGSL